jgi:hypothetical protein
MSSLVNSDPAETIVEAALAGDDALVRSILTGDRGVARQSIHVVAAVPTRMRRCGCWPTAQTSPEVFEQAADLVVNGHLEALRALLDAHPALVHARSPRPHRATLLHFWGGTPAGAARYFGHTDAADLIDRSAATT